MYSKRTVEYTLQVLYALNKASYGMQMFLDREEKGAILTYFISDTLFHVI